MRLLLAVIFSLMLIMGCSEDETDKFDTGFDSPGTLDDPSTGSITEIIFQPKIVPNKSYSFADASLGTQTPSASCIAIMFQGIYDDHQQHLGIEVKSGTFTLKIDCVDTTALDDTTTTITVNKTNDATKANDTFTAKLTIGGSILTQATTDTLSMRIEYVAPGCADTDACSKTQDIASTDTTTTYKIYQITFNAPITLGTHSIQAGDTINAQFNPLP